MLAHSEYPTPEVISLTIFVVAGIIAINQPYLNNVPTIYAFYLLVLLVLPIYLFHRRDGIRDSLGLGYPFPTEVAYIVLIAAAAGAATYFASGSSFLAALFAFGVVPFCEEVFFRGYLLKAFLKYGRWNAVILSALVFDAAHVAVSSGYEAYVLRFVYGALFAILFLNSGRILVPISFHLVVNEFVVFASIKPLNGTVEAELIISGSLLVSLALIDYFRSAALKRRPGKDLTGVAYKT